MLGNTLPNSSSPPACPRHASSVDGDRLRLERRDKSCEACDVLYSAVPRTVPKLRRPGTSYRDKKTPIGEKENGKRWLL